MPIKYRLVLRKDMTKGAAAGSKLVLRREQVHRHLRFRGAVRPDRRPQHRLPGRRAGRGRRPPLHPQATPPERGDRPAGRSRPLPSRDRQQGHQAGVRLQRLPYQTSPDRLPSERDAKERHRPRQVREDRARRTRPGRRRQRIPRRNLTQGSPR